MGDSSWAEVWNGLSPGGFTAATLTTFIIVVISTIIWIFSTLSTKARLRGRPPLPPGTYGLPLLGESIQFAIAMSKEKGLPAFLRKRVKKYGPIFRSHLLGQSTVFMMTPAGNKFLFSNEGKLVENTWPGPVKTLLGPNSLSLKTGEDYKLARRHIGGFFDHRTVVGSHLARVDRNAKEHFAAQWDGKDELSAMKVISAFTFATMASLMASLEEGPEMDELKRDFRIWAFGIMKMPINLPGFSYHAALKARKRIVAKLDEIVKARKQEVAQGRLSESSKSDVLTKLLTVPDEAGRLNTDAEIIDNLLLILFAGYDTSSSALSMLITLVGKNPQVYELLVKEHKEIVERKRENGGRSDSLTTEDLIAMKYTGRVIQEVLRVQPPVSGAFREAITDFEVDGYTILKGWRIMWSNQTLHYDAQFFTNPENFDPARFESTAIPYSYIPFGGGPRTCPGNDFAKMEMMVYVHYLVRNYQWSLIDPEEPIICNPMPKTAKGTPIRITKIKPF